MKERSRAEHIACSAELNDKNVLGYLIIILAAIAMNAVFFMRRAGDIPAIVAAIGMNDDIRLQEWGVGLSDVIAARRTAVTDISGFDYFAAVLDDHLAQKSERYKLNAD